MVEHWRTPAQGDGGGLSIEPITVEFTGSWSAIYPFASVAPVAISVPDNAGGQTYSFPGKWLQNFQPGGDIGLDTITFPDVVGILGAVGPQSTSLSGLSMPALKITMGGIELTQVPALTAVDFSALEVSLQNLEFGPSGGSDPVSGPSSLDLPELAGLYGGITVSNWSALTTLTAPSLRMRGTGGEFQVRRNASLVTMDFGSLDQVPDDMTVFECGSLIGAEFPQLESIGGSLSLDTLASLEATNFSALTSLAGNLTIVRCSTLLSTDFPALAWMGGSIEVANENDSLRTFLAAELETCAGVNIAGAAIVDVSFPSLVEVASGNLSVDLTDNGDNCTQVAFPVLDHVTGLVGVVQAGLGISHPIDFGALTNAGGVLIVGREGDDNDNVTDIDLSSLTHVTESFGLSIGGLDVLTILDLSALQSCAAGGIIISLIPNLTSIDLSALAIIGGGAPASLDIQDCPALTTLTLGPLTEIAANVDVRSTALDQTSVNDLLVKLAALDGTAGTTTYDNHTIYIPIAADGLGAVAQTVLEARGNTVTVGP